MPSRKSADASTSIVPASEHDDSTARPPAATAASNGVGIEDLGLPRSMIMRLAKGVLPGNTQIQKDALLALSKSATVFINHLAANANDRIALAGKKTIQPKDIFDALAELEFAAFVPRAEGELAYARALALRECVVYNAAQCDKRNSYRRRVREEAKAGAPGQEGEKESNGAARIGSVGSTGSGEGADRPARKRAKTAGENGGGGGADDEAIVSGEDEDEGEEGDEDEDEDTMGAQLGTEDEDEGAAEEDEEEDQEVADDDDDDDDDSERTENTTEARMHENEARQYMDAEVGDYNSADDDDDNGSDEGETSD